MKRILDYCKICGKSFEEVERKVKKCNQPKGFTEFNYCIECFKKIKSYDNKKYYQKEKNGKFVQWRRNSLKRAMKLKVDLIVKLGGRCQLCGYDDMDYPTVFDFHHIGKKETTVANLINLYRGSLKGKRKLMKEIKECILVCANCHRKITFPERINK